MCKLCFGLLYMLVGLLTVYSISFGESLTLEAINRAITASNAKWQAGLNPIMKMDADARRRLLGAKEPADQIPRPAKMDQTGKVALPSALDWRNIAGANYVTPIRNQSGCGCCFVFAPVAALESKLLITYDRPNCCIDLSEQIVLSCSGAGDCANGGYADQASDYLRDTGTALEDCYPYTESNGNCADACADWAANPYQLASWFWVNAAWGATAADIKEVIHDNGPVVVWYKIYEDFYAYSSGVYTHTTGTYLGNHFVLVVGWDDAQSAFICKNSWGYEWGDHGYFKIAYSEMTGDTAFGEWAYGYGNGDKNGNGDFSECPYCDNYVMSPDYFGITRVTFAGIDNTTTRDGGYNDYTSLPPAKVSSGSYDLTVTLDTNYYSDISVSAFIDWDRNKLFDIATEMVVVTSQTADNGPYTVSIDVPNEVAGGETLLRLVCKWAGNGVPNPCGEIYYGEIEDYTVAINQDSDSDGIYDDIEETGCTDPNLADSDNDGLEDGIEDADLDGNKDEGETDPCDADSDNDGLRDGEEDANHNGKVDIGETDPRDRDTDDDGFSDKVEINLGSDPGDPLSKPQIPIIPAIEILLL